MSQLRRLNIDNICLGAMVAMILGELATLSNTAATLPLWYDEGLTYLISDLKPFSKLSNALYNGADSMPPAYHFLVQVARQLPIDAHLAVRLPSIVGYAMTLAGIFYCLNRKITPIVGLIAMLIIMLRNL